MTDAPFKEGLRFLTTDAPRPASTVRGEQALLAGWDTIGNSHDGFERQVRDAKWSFFFVAGAIKITTFGFNKDKTIAESVKRLAAAALKLRCNSFEIDHITHVLRLGVSRIAISGHARHLQTGSLMLGT